MLDKNIKNYEASVELLEDRKKTSMMLFMSFYIIGALLSLSPVMFTFTIPLIYTIPIGFTGMTMLILSTWFLMILNQNMFYIFLIKKGLVKAEEKRN